jgi:hypothetical protein
LGTPVNLSVRFDDDVRSLTLCGSVVSETVQPRRSIAIQFAGEEKKRAAGLIALCAGRPLGQGTAAAHRVATNLRCRVAAGRTGSEGAVRDLSLTGAFLTGGKLKEVRPGASVRVCVAGERDRAGREQAWWEAVVVWRGEKHGEVGLGVRFTGPLEERQQQIAAMLVDRGACS